MARPSRNRPSIASFIAFARRGGLPIWSTPASIRSRSRSTRPWARSMTGYFSRRQRTARADRKRYRSSPAAGRDPQILRRARDIQQRRQRRVRHRDLVFKPVQQRFENPDNRGNARQEAFHRRSIARAHRQRHRAIARGANLGQFRRRLIEALDDRRAIAERADGGPCFRECCICRLPGLRGCLHLRGRRGRFLEQRSDIRRPVAGNLLANRQHRAVGLHRLDRLGLAGKGPVLRDKHTRAKDDRQDRHRKHRYRKEPTDPHVVIPLREGAANVCGTRLRQP